MIYQDIYDDLQYQDKIRNLLPDFSKWGLWLLLAFVLWIIYMSMNPFVLKTGPSATVFPN